LVGDKGKDSPSGDGQEDDDVLWNMVVKDVKPLEKNIATDKKSSKPRKVPVKPKNQDVSLNSNNKPKLSASPPDERKQQGLPDIDRRTDEKLRRGKMKIEATIDLHGFNRVDAYCELERFITSSFESGFRKVLVITGKGNAAGSKGVLRENTPQWLQEDPLLKYVLQIHPAQPKDGGGGALYVLLRRNRKE
jgi:DNA-nicking Smr family endonuclease